MSATDEQLKNLNEALEKGGYGKSSLTGKSGDVAVIDNAGNPVYVSSGGVYKSGGLPQKDAKPAFSFNRFIVEPYVSDRTVKTANTGRTEFARIEQKISVKGLKLLVDFKLDTPVSSTANGGPLSENLIRAGSTVFIKEELLHSQQWAKTIMESEHLGKFIIVEKQHIEFIQPL